MKYLVPAVVSSRWPGHVVCCDGVARTAVIIVRLRHLKHVLGASVEVENCKRIGLRNLVRVVGDELSEIEMM